MRSFTTENGGEKHLQKGR